MKGKIINSIHYLKWYLIINSYNLKYGVETALKIANTAKRTDIWLCYEIRLPWNLRHVPVS